MAKSDVERQGDEANRIVNEELERIQRAPYSPPMGPGGENPQHGDRRPEVQRRRNNDIRTGR